MYKRQGPTYEVVGSRARFVAAQTERSTRFIGLSAPIANASDVGEWLGATHTLSFAPTARPVPMEVHIQPFNVPHFPSLMIAMAKPAYLAIVEYAPNQPTLVFVPTRKQTKLTVHDILAYALADSQHIGDGGDETGQTECCFLNMEREDLQPHLDLSLIHI